jgi:cyclophilin family peptidyl-prolyl cis-trans isomerase
MKKKFITTVVILIIASQFIAQNTYSGKPRYQIVTKRNNTTLGIINVELWPNIAPHHVRNFDSLVYTQFYDTTAFHRVVPGFVIQGGDPNSRHGNVSTWGYGQPGQPTVNAEFTVAKHLRGVISAARSTNINSATSQFFICVAPASNLNGLYSAYGKVTSGMTVVDTIVLQPTVGTTQRPVQKIEMFITFLGSNDTVPDSPALLAPPNHTVGLDHTLSVQLKWAAVNDAIMYHLDVSTDSLFVNDTVQSIDLTNAFYFMNNLADSTKYYWRVIANNGGHFSTSNQVWSFSTLPEQETNTNIPKISHDGEFTLFPNPGTGIFTFDNVEDGSTIEIYDLAGKRIETLTVAGNALRADLNKKDKGLYQFRIVKEGKTVQQGKLIVQ